MALVSHFLITVSEINGERRREPCRMRMINRPLFRYTRLRVRGNRVRPDFLPQLIEITDDIQRGAISRRLI